MILCFWGDCRNPHPAQERQALTHIPEGHPRLEGEGGHLMLSTCGLPSPRKNWVLRSVRTTSLSTVNCTFRQKALCSSGVMESLRHAGRPAGVSERHVRFLPPHPYPGWELGTLRLISPLTPGVGESLGGAQQERSPTTRPRWTSAVLAPAGPLSRPQALAAPAPN